MILPLQKLIKVRPDSECDFDHWGAEGEKRVAKIHRENHAEKKTPERPFFKSFLSKIMQKNRSQTSPAKLRSSSTNKSYVPNGFRRNDSPALDYGADEISLPVRTLQRYHGGPNEERIKFMEKHSALATKNLAVAVEQVSIFLTSDNTVISFFESSAEDIEGPMIPRLITPETILRRSADASMLVQVRHPFVDVTLICCRDIPFIC